MPRPQDDLRGHSLLGVFAHPDDESLACGGLLARCAQLGARVAVFCATHGEDGPGGGTTDGSGDAAWEDTSRVLGETRARELAAAAGVLGVAEVVLLDYPDGSLPWADARTLEADICDTIRRIRPDVVVTFGPDGLYWHPDHIAIHERTTAAVAALGDEAPALYYVTMPPGQMRGVVDNAVEHAADNAAKSGMESAGTNTAEPGAQTSSLVPGLIDPDAFGVMADAPTLVVEAGEFAARKLAALKCHRTQLARSALACILERDATRLIGTEHFQRAGIGGAGDAFIERFASPDNGRPDRGEPAS